MENKYEMLKNTIYQLYSKEGRTKSYIARLLELNRKTLIMYINDIWKLPKAEPHRYMKPSTQKFLNKNKQLIKARLDRDVTLVDITKELGCTLSLLNTVISYDSVLKKAKDDYVNRIHINHMSNIENLKHDSSYDGEVWKPILGYDGYYVSNCGRVKHFAKSYNSYHLLDIYYNPTTDRPYVRIANNNFLLYRLVAHAFVDGYTDERNTVNHIDGDTHNNKADNLEWVSQLENNRHARKCLNMKSTRERKYRGKHFIYKGKYEFKTVKAFAKFIDKSETQARRWLDEAEKHDIYFLN